MKEVRLPQGVIRYRDTGQGPVVVLVHGLLVDGRLWDGVVEALAPRHRCIVPDLPLGAHEVPLEPAADRTPAGVAALVADFLDALDLRDVTLVGNDTGGALCQWVAARRPERIGRLVLTPCDTHENFLPPMFRPLQWLARVPALVVPVTMPLRLRPLRRLPIAFGWLAKRPRPDVEQDWIDRFFANPGARRDAVTFLAAIDKSFTRELARELESFAKPALVAFATDDKVFPPANGERLARAMPDARFERIEDSYAFAPVDQPRRVAELIEGFVRESQPVGAH